MVKYHISKETSRPNICKAEQKPCPLGVDTPHFDTKAEAVAHEESKNTSEFDLFSTQIKTPLKKFRTKKFIWDEETNRKRTLELFEENQELYEKLTDQERNTLDFYTRGGSRETNSCLQGKKAHDLEAAKLIERDIAIMDSIFERFEKREARQLFRYLTVPKDMNEEEFSQSLTAKSTYEDKGYMSTTEDLAFIRAYASGLPEENFVILSIETDRGLSMQKKKIEQTGVLQSFEKERLLPRGMKFEILNSSHGSIAVAKERKSLLQQFAPSMWSQWNALPPKGLSNKSFPIIELKSIGD